MQNLKRGSFLRKAIMAPEAHQLVVGDLSQIEPRVLAWFADYEDLLDIFRSGRDAYAAFGAQMFNIPGLSKESHPDLRQSAKSALLGCGYGLGWASFAAQLLVGFLGAPPVRYDKAFAKKLGVTQEYIERFLSWDDNVKKLKEIPHTCTDKELLVHCVAAKKIIDIYRETSHPVVSFWDMCGKLLETARADAVVQTLMTAPGVGPIVALTYRNAIDDPTRFKRSKDVGPWLGLTPTRYQSGQIDRRGHVTKAGDASARTALYEAATTLLGRVVKWSALKSWGLRVAKRSGMKKARVAVARKLAVILHSMWRTQSPFAWAAEKELAPA